MLLLSIDTSSSVLSIALLNEEKVLAYQETIMERGQGEALIPAISDLCKQAHLDISDIDGIAVAIGPGSFTGVRVGLSTARGIGLALNKPVYGVTNFESASYGIFQPITVVLDTKRGDYYTQSFNENGMPVGSPSIQTPEQLKSKLPFTAIGDGAQKLQSEIGCHTMDKISPSAISIGKIAISRHLTPLPPEPLYLRDADVTV